jgi:hypothetical protein
MLVGLVALVAVHAGGAAQAAGTPVWEKPAAPAAPPRMTLEYATELFNRMAARTDIAFGHKADGCYARTHLMNKALRELGVNSGTIWAFSNNSKAFSPLPNLPDNLVVRFADGSTATWWYNNAPVIMVEDGFGDATPYVIDPALCDRPVLVGEWMARHMGGDIKVPYITFTALGVAPTLPNGVSTGGTGYHPGADPAEGLDRNAVETMAKYLNPAS